MPYLSEYIKLCQVKERQIDVTSLGWEPLLIQDSELEEEKIAKIAKFSECFVSNKKKEIVIVYLNKKQKIDTLAILSSSTLSSLKEKLFKEILSLTEYLFKEFLYIQYHKEEYKFFMTGYSYGGVYAHFCAYAQSLPAFTFDNPGCFKEILYQLNFNERQFNYLNSKHFTILSSEDKSITNSLHVGTVYKVKKAPEESLFKILSDTEENTHQADAFPADRFEKITYNNKLSNIKIADPNNIPGKLKIFSQINNDKRKYFANSIAAKDTKLSDDRWLVTHTVVGEYPYHSVLIVEGISIENDKIDSFIGYYELTINKKENKYAQVKVTEFTFHTKMSYCKTRYKAHWFIAKDRAKEMINQIKREEGKEIPYSAIGKESIFSSNHNCTTWVLEILEKYGGIKDPKRSWFNKLVVKPSKNVEEQKETEPDSEINSKLSTVLSAYLRPLITYILNENGIDLSDTIVDDEIEKCITDPKKTGEYLDKLPFAQIPKEDNDFVELCFTCAFGEIESLNKILKSISGNELQMTDDHGLTVLQLSVLFGRTDFIKPLIQAGSDLFQSAVLVDKNFTLLERMFNFSEEKNNALDIAFYLKRYDCLIILLNELTDEKLKEIENTKKNNYLKILKDFEDKIDDLNIKVDCVNFNELQKVLLRLNDIKKINYHHKIARNYQIEQKLDEAHKHFLKALKIKRHPAVLVDYINLFIKKGYSQKAEEVKVLFALFNEVRSCFKFNKTWYAKLTYSQREYVNLGSELTEITKNHKEIIISPWLMSTYLIIKEYMKDKNKNKNELENLLKELRCFSCVKENMTLSHNNIDLKLAGELMSKISAFLEVDITRLTVPISIKDLFLAKFFSCLHQPAIISLMRQVTAKSIKSIKNNSSEISAQLCQEETHDAQELNKKVEKTNSSLGLEEITSANKDVQESPNNYLLFSDHKRMKKMKKNSVFDNKHLDEKPLKRKGTRKKKQNKNVASEFFGQGLPFSANNPVPYSKI